MITQIQLDEMRVKAQEIAQKRVEGWRRAWLADRHPESTPSFAQLAKGTVENGRQEQNNLQSQGR